MSTTVLAAQSNFLVPNATLLVELVAFAIILGVLWRYVLPPIQRAITERQELIRAQFEEARLARQRAEEAEKAYQAALAETRAKAAQIREEARTKGRQILDEKRAKAQEEADRELAHSRQHLATERDSLVRELQAGIGVLGVALAGRIVGESLPDDEQTNRWVEEFLAKSDEATSSAPAGAAAGPSTGGDVA